MTREEAISKLKDILEEATETEHAVCYVTSEDAEALSMAIEALKDRPEEVHEDLWVCPQCGFVTEHNICPNCGAKLQGGDTE